MDKGFIFGSGVIIAIFLIGFVLADTPPSPYDDGRSHYQDCINLVVEAPHFQDCEDCYDSCFAYCEGEYEGLEREDCLNGCDAGYSICYASLPYCPFSSAGGCAGGRVGEPCWIGDYEGVCNQNDPSESCYCAI